MRLEHIFSPVCAARLPQIDEVMICSSNRWSIQVLMQMKSDTLASNAMEKKTLRDFPHETP